MTDATTQAQDVRATVEQVDRRAVAVTVHVPIEAIRAILPDFKPENFGPIVWNGDRSSFSFRLFEQAPEAVDLLVADLRAARERGEL